jgi:hypothetical protein
MEVYDYNRVSTDKQANDSESLGSQKRTTEPNLALRLFAKTLGANTGWPRFINRRLLMLLLGGAAFAVVAAFVLLDVRPFEPPPPLSNEALAASWNESISRLGISPLYPPQEDFQVGDLMAVIVGAENTSLLRKSVRVAHVDMRDLILKEQEDRLVFADTVVAKEDDPIRISDRLSVVPPPSDRVALTLAAFPGFTIRYSSGRNASARTSRFSLTGTRNDEQVEEIRIPLAETYGVSSASAVERLEDWCSREESRQHCTSELARTTLQFTFGERILAEVDGVQPHVELVLITKVYLMRQIEQRRISNSNRNVGATVPLDSSGSAVPGSGSSASSSAAESAAGRVAASAGGAQADASRNLSTEITLRRSFPRPIAFGYRSVSILPQ